MAAIRRSRASITAVVIWSNVLICQGRAEEAGAKAELPYQVREILRRHCLDCHGDTAKGGIKLLDRALLVEQRQVVRPSSPETSELFDLVAGGSMPPGNRPKVPAEEQDLLRSWIQAGAPSLPNNTDESYVLWSILHDFRDRPDKQKPFVRYLSLNHLLARDHALLDQQRRALRDMLRYLTAQGKPPPELQPIKYTDSVFCIDLRELGWDRPPYPNEKLNLFDLILLEYPYGRLPIRSPFYPELLSFLRTANQVRPVSYVRADWLVQELSRPPLHSDFLHVLGKPPHSKPPQDAAAGDTAGVLAIQFVAALPGYFLGGLVNQPQTVGGHLELLDRNRKNSIPILPLDGLTYHPKPHPDIEFRAIDAKQRENADPPAKDTFAPGDRMALWIKTLQSSVVEVIHTDKNGRKRIPESLKSFHTEAGKATPLTAVKMQLDENEQQDSEEYTIYVYPREDLKAMNVPFPGGKVLNAEGVNGRVVHPLYKLRDDGGGFEPPDADKMAKRTITVKTRRK